MQAGRVAIDSAFAKLTAAQVDYAREELLQRARMQVVDGFYRLGPGDVTPDMRSAAKVAITDELQKWPIETLRWEEIVMRAEATRDRIWAPYWTRQQEERVRDADTEARRREAQLQELERLRKRTRRRAILIEQGVYQAQDAAEKGGFPPAVREVVLIEIRTRLEATLTGDETANEAREAIDAMVLPPVLEWTRRLAAQREAQRTQQWARMLSLSLPVVEAALPWVEHQVVEHVCHWLDLKRPCHGEAAPAADAASQATPHNTAPGHTAAGQGSSPSTNAQDYGEHIATSSTDSRESESPTQAA